MARTTIEGGCKAVLGSGTVDTVGFGKVTLLSATGGAISATGGETEETVGETIITAHIIDPVTGANKTSPAAYELLAYNGSMRYIQVTAPNDVIVLLSEPRQTN